MSNKTPDMTITGAIRIVFASMDLNKLRAAGQDSSTWATPIFLFLAYIDKDQAVAKCARAGIRAFEILSRDNKNNEEIAVERSLIAKELANDYPVVNAHHTASLWQLLDVALSDVAAMLLTSNPELLSEPLFRKIKFTAADFESLSRVQRMRRVVSATKEHLKETDKTLSRGVNVYEHIFQKFGLESFDSDEHLKRLAELKAVRNIIVHNNSAVDHRFIEQCPWLCAKEGDEFQVTTACYNRYIEAIIEYTTSVFGRLNKRFPIPTKPAATAASNSGEAS